MNGTKTDLNETLCSSSIAILETMFFSEASLLDGPGSHVEPLACMLQCTGAENGTFSIAVDRAALNVLCESFYGESEVSATQSFELICELTNMIAGSTLSVFSPDRLCALSSPQLCDVALHTGRTSDPDTLFASFAIEGGILSIACTLRTK
jgi:hypothetical protein